MSIADVQRLAPPASRLATDCQWRKISRPFVLTTMPVTGGYRSPMATIRSATVPIGSPSLSRTGPQHVGAGDESKETEPPARVGQIAAHLGREDGDAPRGRDEEDEVAAAGQPHQGRGPRGHVVAAQA